MRDHHLFVDACAWQTVAPERAARAVAGPEEATAPGDPQEAQDLPTRALQDVVPGIVTETSQRNPASGRVLAYRDHRVDAAALKPAVDPGVGITGIGRHCLDLATGDRPNLIDPSLDRLALACRTGCHYHIQHHAACGQRQRDRHDKGPEEVRPRLHHR